MAVMGLGLILTGGGHVGTSIPAQDVISYNNITQGSMEELYFRIPYEILTNNITKH